MIIGVITLYLGMFYIVGLVQAGITLDPSPYNNIRNLLYPDPNTIKGGVFVVSWTYVENTAKALALQFPTLLTGNLAWIQWYLFNPIGAAMILSLLLAIRGTPST
jgi:hypothetical protein